MAYLLPVNDTFSGVKPKINKKSYGRIKNEKAFFLPGTPNFRP